MDEPSQFRVLLPQLWGIFLLSSSSSSSDDNSTSGSSDSDNESDDDEDVNVNGDVVLPRFDGCPLRSLRNNLSGGEEDEGVSKIFLQLRDFLIRQTHSNYK